MTGAILERNLRQTLSGGSIRWTALPLVPEISLLLLGEDYPRGRLDHDEMLAVMNAPAYWAFCWASGQVLARYILDHREHFAGRFVLDFGSGSGVVAVAAALAGASRVIACDIDPHALDASRENAARHGVSVELLDDIDNLEGTPDIAIAADVLYDRDNLPWLERLPRLAREVIIADSRVKTQTMAGFDVVMRQTATTVPDLDELREYNDVRVYRARPVLPSGQE